MTRDTDEVIDEFFAGSPRAAEWRALRQALGDRLRGLRRERDGETDPARRTALDAQVASLTKQVGTLETEEVVARFVEDSVKATLAPVCGRWGKRGRVENPSRLASWKNPPARSSPPPGAGGWGLRRGQWVRLPLGAFDRKRCVKTIPPPDHLPSLPSPLRGGWRGTSREGFFSEPGKAPDTKPPPGAGIHQAAASASAWGAHQGFIPPANAGTEHTITQGPKPCQVIPKFIFGRPKSCADGSRCITR